MPVHREGSGWEWGGHGKVYHSKKDAEKQAAAAHANGYTGDEKPNGAGVLLRDPDGHALFLLRSSTGDHAHEWCLPGGGAEGDEEPEDTARRELQEETGLDYEEDLDPVHRSADDSPVNFVTLTGDVGERFAPRLNDEHLGYAWAPLDKPPQPLHPGVEATLDALREQAEDASQEKISERIKREIDRGHDPKQAAAIAYSELGEDSLEVLDIFALDRAATVRSYDEDGTLRVGLTPISKANVCPYVGREIPDNEKLGLDPDKIYYLYRDPDELEKAVPTFNGLPLLSEHVPVSVDEPSQDKTVGWTGESAVFETPYLKNSLVVRTRDAIDGIESDEKKELSSAYRYRADMTPGTAPDGTRYDGVMRDIVGNHVALVEEGRAGSDVVVGDGLAEELAMSKTALSKKATLAQGALLVFLRPRLAKDHQLDLSKILLGVTAKNWGEKKPLILEAVKPALAQDAKLEDVHKLLDSLDKEGPSEDEDVVDEGAGQPKVGEPDAEDADVHERLAEFLKDKLAPEDLDEALKMVGGGSAEDEDEEERRKKEEEERRKKEGASDADDDEEKGMSKEEVKEAMDAAVKTAQREAAKTQREIREAEKAVQPYVGELAVACDSAEQVYRAALDMLGVDHKLVKDPAALPLILKAQNADVDKRRKTVETRLAADAAARDSYEKMFPGAEHIGSVG